MFQWEFKGLIWDKLVMQGFLVVYRAYPTRDLIFLYTHFPKARCVCRKIKSLVVYHLEALRK